MYITKEKVVATGKKGTYSTTLGAIGLAYQMPTGEVVCSGGNGWFCSIANLADFQADGGLGYERAYSEISRG